MNMKLGVELQFDAAHSLPRYEGKCKNIHGHTYTAEVIVSGKVDGETHFILDYFILKKLLGEVIAELDHRYLNEILEYPTSERIAQYIYRKMREKLKGYNVELISIKLWEGKDKWVKIEKGDED
ncbi:MAG: 6-carboxytetrahydropterin synthase QueD [Methanocellales archaeon]